MQTKQQQHQQQTQHFFVVVCLCFRHERSVQNFDGKTNTAALLSKADIKKWLVEAQFQELMTFLRKGHLKRHPSFIALLA